MHCVDPLVHAYVPVGHGLHVLAFETLLYELTSHGVHCVDPSLSAYLPGVHPVHCAWFGALACPRVPDIQQMVVVVVVKGGHLITFAPSTHAAALSAM